MLEVGTRLADRFVVERWLGEGGMGVVFEALDESRGERVALKTLGRMDGEAIYRLKKEFRVLTDLVHPNLIRLHELFTDRDVWFFSMQRVHGVPFVEYVRRAEPPLEYADTEASGSGGVTALPFGKPTPLGGSVDEMRLRAATLALVEGVEAIHRAGKLHRDLKPSNVLVDQDGRVTILDFGLVEPERPGASMSQDGAGTPAYMAPEQLVTNGVCPESDWYAVGAMLFEALTGELPFRGSTFEVISAKARKDLAPDPRVIAPDVPEDLAALARNLLAPLPDRRPKSAQIRATLGSVDLSNGASPSTATLFVGRTEELARLEAAFEARSGVIAVRGLSGMGKSTLIERFLASVEQRAFVLSGRCYERETVPFKALDPIVDELSRRLLRMNPIDAAALTPRDAPELCRLFPVLARVASLSKASLTRAPNIEPAEVRRRAFEALRELFARLAETQPVVVVIDDLQWGDLDSGHLLARLVASPEAPKLLVVLGYRLDEESRSPLLTHLAEHTQRGVIDLAPLGEEDARSLAAMLGANRETARAIARESGGSPFFIGALASTGEDMSLENAISSRVAKLEPSARALLEVVAVAGSPIARDVALRAAKLGPAEDAAIPLLRVASLLRTTLDELLVTYHDRIREAVVAGLDADKRRAIHIELAERIDPSDVDRRALHYREGGRREEALRYTVLAAERATSALAAERAASLYKEAVVLAPDDSRATLRRHLADALADAGHAVEAADVYLELARQTNDLDLEIRAAGELTVAGHTERGVEVASRVSRRLGVWLPRTSGAAVFVSLFLLAYIHLFRFLRKTRRQLTDVERPRIEAMQTFALSFSLVDTQYAFYFAARSTMAAIDSDDPEIRLLALLNLGWTTAFVLPRHRRVRAVLSELRAIESPNAEAMYLLGNGIVSELCGRWREADESFEAGESHAFHGLLRQGAYTNTIRTWRSWALFWRGRFRELARVGAEHLADATARGNLVSVLGTLQVAVVAYVAQDDAARARREADEAFALWPMHESSRLSSFTNAMYWDFATRSVIDLYTGDGEDTHRRLEAAWPAIESSGLLRSAMIGMFLRWTRCLLALNHVVKLARAERAPVLSIVEGEAAALERNPTIGATAKATGFRAAAAHARGDEAESLRLLTRAIELYDEADLGGIAACARYRLGGPERERAMEFMEREGIVCPEKFVRVLTPGFDAK